MDGSLYLIIRYIIRKYKASLEYVPLILYELGYWLGSAESPNIDFCF